MQDKDESEAFFSKGCGTALVNIIKSCKEMQIDDSEFIDCILQGVSEHIDELDIPWITILFTNAS